MPSFFAFSDSKWRFYPVLISCRSPAQSHHQFCSICTIMRLISLSLLLPHVSLAVSSHKLALPVMKFLPFPPILTTLLWSVIRVKFRKQIMLWCLIFHSAELQNYVPALHGIMFGSFNLCWEYFTYN